MHDLKKYSLNQNPFGKGIREACGIVGIFSKDSSIQVSQLTYDALLSLQHRGQESAGIYAYADSMHRINGYKNMGLVTHVFSRKILQGIFGHVSVGHVRYSTTATSSLDNAQPFLYDYESGESKFALAFNGTLTNFLSLRRQLKKQGHEFTTSTDTEVIAHVILEQLKEQGDDYPEALRNCLDLLDGSYSLAIMNRRNEIYAIRDPLGFKPYTIGQLNDPEIFIAASESVAIDALEGIIIRDIRPGEILRIYEDGLTSEYVRTKPRKAFCMFEYVYFSRPDSIIGKKSVYNVRVELGRALARHNNVKADAVVAVPDSGRAAAIGFAEESGIPFREGLIRNRYVHRTFIMPSQTRREDSVRKKMNPIKSVVMDKDIVLIDDSIVRGTTLRRIVRLLKSYGARKIHVRISCPPIVSGCFMGIDFPTRKELIAGRMKSNVNEICKFIQADSLVYQTIDDLVKCCGKAKNELCLACLNREYPIKTPVDHEKFEQEFGIQRE